MCDHKAPCPSRTTKSGRLTLTSVAAVRPVKGDTRCMSEAGRWTEVRRAHKAAVRRCAALGRSLNIRFADKVAVGSIYKTAILGFRVRGFRKAGRIMCLLFRKHNISIGTLIGC